MGTSHSVYVVFGQTESGDDWRLVFRNKPSHSSIMLAIEDDPWLFDEYENGCIQGWSTEKENVIDNS